MKPFLRWTGGKTKLLPELRKHVPHGFTRYFEPFLGGGAMFFDLNLVPCPGLLGVFLGDANGELMNMYDVLRGPECAEVVNLANGMIGQHNECIRIGKGVEDFYAGLRRGGAGEVAVVRAARFLYLNRASFNGLWRENKRGIMNNPVGSRVKLLEPWDRERLLAAGNRLRGCVLMPGQSYEWFLGQANPGTFVYLDPPYDVEPGAKGFTAYNAAKFNQTSQTRLAERVRRAVYQGAKVLVSNAGTSMVRSLYSGIGTIHEVTCSRGWRTKEHGAKVPEVIIRCGY